MRSSLAELWAPPGAAFKIRLAAGFSYAVLIGNVIELTQVIAISSGKALETMLVVRLY